MKYRELNKMHIFRVSQSMFFYIYGSDNTETFITLT